MPTFEVTTESKFELKYLVDAKDEKAAIELVLNELTTDGFQKHLGEKATQVKQTELKENEWQKEMRSRDYW